MESLIRKKIFDYALLKFCAEPEYLWVKYPGYAVLRRKDCNKWFAVVMNVTKNKIGINSTDEVEILAIKCGKLMSGSLLNEDGFYPAYHLNKSNWISIILDGSVDFDTITNMIDLSYDLVGK